MIGFGENEGSGFPKILKAWKDKNWIEPKLENNLDCQEVKLTLTMIVDEKAAGEDDAEMPVRTVSEEYAEYNEIVKAKRKAKLRNQDRVLEILSVNPTSTASQIADIIGTSMRQVQRYISELQKLRYIVREGGDKIGKWKVL